MTPAPLPSSITSALTKLAVVLRAAELPALAEGIEASAGDARKTRDAMEAVDRRCGSMLRVCEPGVALSPAVAWQATKAIVQAIGVVLCNCGSCGEHAADRIDRLAGVALRILSAHEAVIVAERAASTFATVMTVDRGIEVIRSTYELGEAVDAYLVATGREDAVKAQLEAAEAHAKASATPVLEWAARRGGFVAFVPGGPELFVAQADDGWGFTSFWGGRSAPNGVEPRAYNITSAEEAKREAEKMALKWVEAESEALSQAFASLLPRAGGAS